MTPNETELRTYPAGKPRDPRDPFSLEPPSITPPPSPIPSLSYEPEICGNQLAYYEIFGYPDVPIYIGDRPLPPEQSSPCENRVARRSQKVRIRAILTATH
jgi:hypothetical protein